MPRLAIKERVRRRYPVAASVGSFVIGFFAGYDNAFLTVARILFY